MEMTETGDLTSVPTSVIRPIPFLVIFKDLTHVFSMDAIGREILSMAFPAALALASDPIASLIDTAFIGRLGAVELAAVGVSIAIFNQASRITIFPIVSVTTSFVAEEDTMEKMKEEEANKANHADTLLVQDSLEKGIASATSNNTSQTQQTPASVTKSSSGNKANKTGKKTIKSASTAMIIGLILGLYLTIRSLGAPALLLSLSMQGIFRGFKDTTTPLYATLVADIINIILDPIFIFVLRLGVSGAAIAHVISQYSMTLILFIRLAKKVNLMPPNFGDLQFGKFLRNDEFEMQMGFMLGLGLSVFVGLGLYFGAGIFTKDPTVIHLIAIGIPFVAATQPINSLAFVLDGVNFGASDFAYTAYSMVGVAAISIAAIIYMAKSSGFIGLWIALTIYMGLRAITGIARIATGTGPWKFLRGRSPSSS
ncbi:unnamed protein product [Thlaspi arvense]|uniref:Protein DETOXIFICATION n=1 Tax=Thlaspi arvense TaxID=13288 RepID=A0AAU9S052_THLAR|nr:unnamed protein product [Thlaspi arvense]